MQIRDLVHLLYLGTLSGGLAQVRVYVGTSGYAYKEWRGAFYPEKASSAEMLQFYSKRLNAVEINSTFYQMPRENVLRSWAQQVPDSFVFALKAPQVITHIKRLRNVDAEIDYLFSTLSVLDRKLGPVLFQFPGGFRIDRPVLEGFLGQLPDGAKCAFAFRNPSWLEPEILDLLRSRNCGLCMEDTDDVPIGIPITTATWGYLRLRRTSYTEDGLSTWAEKILSQRWDTAYAFVKHENEGASPAAAMRLRELIDQG